MPEGETATQALLLVDDDENVLRGLARILRRQPYQIFTAKSAEEANWILKTHPIDVIVADEQMPGRSGTDLLAWAAVHCPEVVRIVLTGHATTEIAIRAINQGMVYQFFTKPCDAVALALAIRKAMDEKQRRAGKTASGNPIPSGASNTPMDKQSGRLASPNHSCRTEDTYQYTARPSTPTPLPKEEGSIHGTTESDFFPSPEERRGR